MRSDAKYDEILLQFKAFHFKDFAAEIGGFFFGCHKSNPFVLLSSSFSDSWGPTISIWEPGTPGNVCHMWIQSPH